MTPQGWLGRTLSGVEMVFGVTMVGAWTATLLRKFIR
ncbi:MAG: hypothetical protein D3910_14085 [Candidatus Electrothrix sp. ATG2]|nr:hypothetical protein [Candidatus Electrothrix sp. ATG2]